MLFPLARHKAKGILSRAGHTRTKALLRDVDQAGAIDVGFGSAGIHSATSCAGPKRCEKPIVQFIAFATEIFPCANEQLEATAVMVRASPPLPTFKI
jgi:hypothetical protein